MERGESAEVYWARDAIDAHAVRALLEDAGIDALVENELLQGATGEIPTGPATSPRVRVAGDDAERALALIEEWRADRGADAERVRPDWTCGQCGEDVEGDFDICWNCGGDEKLPAQVRESADESASAPGPPPPPAPPSRWRGPARAVAVLVAEMVGQVAGVLLIALFGVVASTASDAETAISYLSGAVGGLLAVYIASRACFGREGAAVMWRRLGLVGTSARCALTGAAVGCALVLTFIAIEVWILPPDPDLPTSELDEMAQSSAFGFWVWAALLVVFAPLTEELLFRGAMLHGFMQRWGATTSVVLVTLIFTALHLPDAMYYWPSMVGIGAFGVASAVLRLRTGSLVPPMIAHVAYNLTIVLFAFV